MTPSQLEALLQTLRRELAKALGLELDEVVLYGSRARGEARPDSDIDVLIVVNGELPDLALTERISEITARLSLEHDVVISHVFASRMRYHTAQSPFFINVRREGVPL